MICGFRDKDAAAIFARRFVRRLKGIEQAAYKRLKRLDAAQRLADLRAIPGNHLEALKADRKGQYSNSRLSTQVNCWQKISAMRESA